MPASQRAAGAELGGAMQACHTPPALLLKRDPVCQQEAPGETQVSSEPRRLLSPAGHRPFALSPGVIRTVFVASLSEGRGQ